MYDNTLSPVQRGDSLIQLSLWDTALRSMEAMRLVQLSWPNTDVFLACFSVASMSALESLKNDWLPQLQQYQANESPKRRGVILLVGLKSDLRDCAEFAATMKERKLEFVTQQQAQEFAEQIGAKYIECSSKTGSNVAQVFDLAIDSALKAKAYSRHTASKSKSKCYLM